MTERWEETARAHFAGNGNGTPVGAAAQEKPRLFPDPIPASQLVASDAAAWVVHGYLARGESTLLSALWKAGKTTWLAWMLRVMAQGGDFCGRRTMAAQVLYVTEEGQGRWCKRRDAVGIEDNVHFLIRPYKTKPDWTRWMALLDHLGNLQVKRPVDLMVIDTLSNLWPVRDENDAAGVTAALMPLHQLIEDKAALLLVHHNRKGDGQEATASRGSGALTAWVDTIVELRRFDAAVRDDCRRVLTAYGRDDETPHEVVVELGDDGFRAHGSRETVRIREVEDQLLRALPSAPPGATYEELKEAWVEDEFPRRQRVLDALQQLMEQNVIHRTGRGVKGNPYQWWPPPPP